MQSRGFGGGLLGSKTLETAVSRSTGRRLVLDCDDEFTMTASTVAAAAVAVAGGVTYDSLLIAATHLN